VGSRAYLDREGAAARVAMAAKLGRARRSYLVPVELWSEDAHPRDEGGRFAQAELDSHLAGLHASMPPGSKLVVYRAGPDELHVNSIGVPKQNQNEGHGTRVMRSLLNFADERDMKVTLDPQADPGKKAALSRFYTGLGFGSITRRKFYDATARGGWVRPKKSERRPGMLACRHSYLLEPSEQLAAVERRRRGQEGVPDPASDTETPPGPVAVPADASAPGSDPFQTDDAEAKRVAAILASLFAMAARNQAVSAAERLKLGINASTVEEIAQQVGKARAAEIMGMKVSPSGGFVPDPAAERAITTTTEAQVTQAVDEAVAAPEDTGPSLLELLGIIGGLYAFTPERADVVADVESGEMENTVQLMSYQDAGITHVTVSDGELWDEPCIEANGQVWTIEDALLNPKEHPYCQRTFDPVMPDDLLDAASQFLNEPVGAKLALVPEALGEFDEGAHPRDEGGRFADATTPLTEGEKVIARGKLDTLEQHPHPWQHAAAPGHELGPVIHPADLGYVPHEDLHVLGINKVSKKFYDVQNVPVGNIAHAQPFVPVGGLRAYIENLRTNTDPIELGKVKGDDRYHVLSGHTRIGVHMLAGRETVPARVYHYEKSGRFGRIGQVPKPTAAQKLAAWSEEDHPRDEGGKFADAEGGGGVKEPWQMTRDEHAGVDWKAVAEGRAPAPTGEAYSAISAKNQEWAQSVLAAASLGKLDQNTATGDTKYALKNAGDFKDMPPDLYHVTTAADAVEANGLKSRYELGQVQGAGLGGGDDKSISFTADKAIADQIKRSMIEAHDVAAGKKTIAEMWKDATTGANASKPYDTWITQLETGNSAWKHGDPVHPAVDAWTRGKEFKMASLGRPPDDTHDWTPSPHDPGWMGGDGKMRYSFFERDMTPDEKRDRAFHFYQALASGREQSGGPMDPLFFTSDTKALARMNPEKDVAILHFKPKPGAKGTNMSALGEWRTYTGKAVDYQGRK
jgi:ribosomal protein S18 acetylase RimI-like enzyme